MSELLSKSGAMVAVEQEFGLPSLHANAYHIPMNTSYNRTPVASFWTKLTQNGTLNPTALNTVPTIVRNMARDANVDQTIVTMLLYLSNVSPLTSQLAVCKYPRSWSDKLTDYFILVTSSFPKTNLDYKWRYCRKCPNMRSFNCQTRPKYMYPISRVSL